MNGYAVIGDSRTAALVSRCGSIDWLCLPHFSGASVFGALLDQRQGGRFSVCPEQACDVRRRYVGPTNVLETTFRSDAGTVRVTDLMPLTSGGLHPERELLRIIEGLEGETMVRIVFQPRPDYARSRGQLVRRTGCAFACEHGGALFLLRTDIDLTIDGNGGSASGLVPIRAGERRYLSFGYNHGTIGVLPALGAAADHRLATTLDWWNAWSRRCRYRGPHRDAVIRSLLTVKLMAYALSGAIVAAPTTSLPEVPGGSANWDYRYCWLRDAALALQSLMALGYEIEAEAFLGWLLHATRLTQPRLQVMYDVYGEADLPEQELPHLEGYGGARPVRIGNAACGQLQLDVYGEVVAAAHAFVGGGGRLDRDEARLLAGFGKVVCKVWREPDQGIWERRGGAWQNTQSKVMCWVALDRLLQLHGDGRLEVPADDFRRERAAIGDAIERHGYNADLDSYVGMFDSRRLDASLLLMARYGYRDPCDPRMRTTYERIERHVGRDGLMFRYADVDSDATPAEGAFGLCGFWAVDYLARRGDVREAAQRFERLLSYANDVGLFGEEIEPGSGKMLGNFPQTYTHVGVLGAALSLADALERRKAA